MDAIMEALGAEWAGLVELAPRVAVALVVLALGWLLGRVAAGALDRGLRRSDLRNAHREFFRRVLQWAFLLGALAIALEAMGWGRISAGLVAGGSVTAIIVGFAFREIGENLLAGFFLAFNRPFDVGDLVRQGEFEGTVRGIDLRTTHLRSADGRDIYVPNARIFKEPLVNFTRDGLRRGNFTLGIDVRDDASRARELLGRTVAATEGVLDSPAAMVLVEDLADNWVVLRVFFWVDSFAEPGLGAVRGRLLEACLPALLEAGFTLSPEVSTNLNLATPARLRMELEGRG